VQYAFCQWFRRFEFGCRFAGVIEIFCRVPQVVHDVNRMEDETSECRLPSVLLHMESHDS
jgi:hypothetical protein